MPGQHQRARAGHGGGFHEEDITAHTRYRETRRDARHGGADRCFVKELRPPERIAHRLVIDRQSRGLVG